MRWFLLFEVLNEDHPWVIGLRNVIDAILSPITNPVKRLVPNLWGIDLSIMAVLTILIGARLFLVQLVGQV